MKLRQRLDTDPRRPGVEIKHLGTFNEYGTSVALWRLEPGAVIASETLDAPQVRCVVRGAMTYGGRKLDDKACYYIPEGIGTEPLASPDGAELLVFSIPMYARATWDKAKSRRVAATA